MWRSLAYNFGPVNYLAVLVAAIAAMVIGFLWYSPALLGPAWMNAKGIDPKDPAQVEKMKKGAAVLYAATFIAVLITATALAVVINRVNADSTPLGGIKWAVLVWLGFVATVQFTANLFGNRNRTLFLIDGGHQLISYIVMGAILGVWR